MRSLLGPAPTQHLPEVMPLFALASRTEHKSWLQCYLDTGMPGHFATFAFLGTLAFAVIIFRKRLGLRYRLALLPLTMIPLVSGVMGCCYDYAIPWLPPDFDARNPYPTIRETPLQSVVMTSMQTGILLLASIALLLHKDAGRRCERQES